MRPNKLATSAFCLVLFSVVTTHLCPAQDRSSPQSFPSFTEWKTNDEVTVGGAILGVASMSSAGAPAGLNLQISGSQGVLYASLGPNLGNDVTRELTSGQVIRVTGLVRTFHGQNYLLVRELVIAGQNGDQKIEIRNDHGFLAHTSASAAPGSKRSESELNGGAR